MDYKHPSESLNQAERRWETNTVPRAAAARLTAEPAAKQPRAVTPQSLFHRDIIDSERRRERGVISRAKLNADRLPGEGGEAERPSLYISARRSFIQIAESGQRREQRAGCVPNFDKESVELG